MIIDEHKLIFIPLKLLKHSRPYYVNEPVKFYVHEENPKICPVQTIKHYLDKQKKKTLPMKQQHSSFHTENYLRQLMKSPYLVVLRK